jgi:hypothetical protein
MRPNTVLALFAAVAICAAFPSYTGYSGAPGSSGTCSGGCHGTSGGTITVAGFPTTYAAGQTYTIIVAHDGGATVENFNASVRIGTTSQNAGVVAAGTNTATYNVSGETNGVHFGTAGQESGTFTWTAPSPPVGPVTLYLSGLQGTKDGPKTELVLTAQGAGIADGRTRAAGASFRLEQTVVTSHLVLRVDNPGSVTRVRIFNHSGRVVARLSVAPGANQALAWPLLDAQGRRLAPGVYYASFSSSGPYRTAKFAVAAR